MSCAYIHVILLKMIGRNVCNLWHRFTSDCNAKYRINYLQNKMVVHVLQHLTKYANYSLGYTVLSLIFAAI